MYPDTKREKSDIKITSKKKRNLPNHLHFLKTVSC